MLYIIKKTGRTSAICKCDRCGKNYIVKSIYDAQKSPVGDICTECKRFIIDMELTQENLRKAYNYDPNTGIITHKHTTLSGKKDEIATWSAKQNKGYLVINIGKKADGKPRQLLAHRMIFMYMEGYIPEQVDHINHKRDDNRWINLRSASHIENCKNCSISKNNTSKITGVALHKPTGKYRAYIGKNYKQIHLGLFNTIEEARNAREKANEKYSYHKNHGVQGLV